MNINLELQRALVHEKEIESLDFDTAVARLQDIDNRLRRFAESAATYRARSSLPRFGSPAPSRPLTTSEGGDAMDLSASSYSPRGPLSQEEKERRRKLGLCYYCGKGVHRAVDSTLLRKGQSLITGRSAEVTEIEEGVEVLAAPLSGKA